MSSIASINTQAREIVSTANLEAVSTAEKNLVSTIGKIIETANEEWRNANQPLTRAVFKRQIECGLDEEISLTTIRAFFHDECAILDRYLNVKDPLNWDKWEWKSIFEPSISNQDHKFSLMVFYSLFNGNFNFIEHLIRLLKKEKNYDLFNDICHNQTWFKLFMRKVPSEYVLQVLDTYERKIPHHNSEEMIKTAFEIKVPKGKYRPQMSEENREFLGEELFKEPDLFTVKAHRIMLALSIFVLKDEDEIQWFQKWFGSIHFSALATVSVDKITSGKQKGHLLLSPDEMWSFGNDAARKIDYSNLAWPVKICMLPYLKPEEMKAVTETYLLPHAEVLLEPYMKEWRTLQDEYMAHKNECSALTGVVRRRGEGRLMSQMAPYRKFLGEIPLYVWAVASLSPEESQAAQLVVETMKGLYIGHAQDELILKILPPNKVKEIQEMKWRRPQYVLA